jgi:hypothetical protein
VVLLRLRILALDGEALLLPGLVGLRVHHLDSDLPVPILLLRPVSVEVDG